MSRKSKATPLTIIDLCKDRNLLNLSLSPAQETLLASFYGLPLTKDQRELYAMCTGRSEYRAVPYQELTVVAGARSGKDSRVATPIAIYEALFGQHESRLHKGETGIVAIVAQDREATSVCFNYVKGAVMASPYLRSMLSEEPLANELRFSNGIKVVTFPCSLKSLRAYSICVGILDELAFYRLEGGANSDAEIQSSIRRGMVSFGEHGKLIKISTPFARDGVLYDDFKNSFGKNDPDILVFKGTTALFNPEVYGSTLERERRRDPARFAREYEAEFAENLESLISQEQITRAVIPGREALAPADGKAYFGGVDASGGGSCAFTIAICTVEIDSGGRHRIVECVSRGWERENGEALDLEGVVEEASAIFAEYGCYQVMSDKYSAGWSRQSFGRRGIEFLDAQDKSTTYAELAPLFTANRIDLLDHACQNRELGLLERRPRPGGKPLIAPPRGAHDDYANSLALAAVAAAQNADSPPIDYRPQPGELDQLHEVFPQLEIMRFESDFSR